MISDRLKGVILRALDLEEYDLRDDSRASEVPGWDSLSHVKVILEVEREYRIRLATRDLIRLKNVGDLQALVDKKVDVV